MFGLMLNRKWNLSSQSKHSKVGFSLQNFSSRTGTPVEVIIYSLFTFFFLACKDNAKIGNVCKNFKDECTNKFAPGKYMKEHCPVTCGFCGKFEKTIMLNYRNKRLFTKIVCVK